MIGEGQNDLLTLDLLGEAVDYGGGAAYTWSAI